MLKANGGMRSMVQFNSPVTVCKLAAHRQQGVTVIHDVAKPKQRESYFNSAQFCSNFFFFNQRSSTVKIISILTFLNIPETPRSQIVLWLWDATLKRGVKSVSYRVTQDGRLLMQLRFTTLPLQWTQWRRVFTVSQSEDQNGFDDPV